MRTRLRIRNQLLIFAFTVYTRLSHLLANIHDSSHDFASRREAEVWTNLKAGDKNALGFFYTKYLKSLYNYGMKVSRDAGLVEDCIQDLFADIWQSKAASEVESVKAYLFKALKYKIFKKQRNRLLKNHSGEFPDEMMFEISHDTFLAEEQENKERVRKVIEALNKLPNRQREVIYLKIFHELSYEEVSDIMNINYQVCRNLMSQAIKALRKILVIITVLATIPVI